MTQPWIRGKRDGRLVMPYGAQPTKEQVKQRFVWNVTRLLNPFKWSELNPFVLKGEGDLKPKERTAWEDIFHSAENLWKEHLRREKRK